MSHRQTIGTVERLADLFADIGSGEGSDVDRCEFPDPAAKLGTGKRAKTSADQPTAGLLSASATLGTAREGDCHHQNRRNA